MAEISQLGVDNPTAIIFEDTIEDIVLTRTNPGIYRISSNKFINKKVFINSINPFNNSIAECDYSINGIFFGPVNGPNAVIRSTAKDSGYIELRSRTVGSGIYTDGLFSLIPCFVEIVIFD